ncbi:hypothetical protein K8640_29530 [Myxococcus sp. XM-1-1-1]|uniref:hypothetical protein n=1 Tax=Myxococcus sp. XM-1-1-1 TaxID=2874602 RepID=UPI001CBBD14F|nr:hypothetical protein [Myxococcus sp. XM-1-1-1]MBZ4412371.1 hypothetical protein [Myxococcus sp. XM-1-1-1]BDT33884.1 lipoprotein [Myxococcus sp. MH1]
MRAKSGWAVMLLGALGCGGPEARAESPVSTAEAPLLAPSCPTGGAQRVKVVIPPGTPEPPPFAGLSPAGFVGVQGTAYFTVNYPDGASVLWRTQGTEGSTVQVRAFSAMWPERALSPRAPLGDKLLFTVYTPESGREPWVSDGTEVGTRLLKDVTPGPEGTAMSQVSVWGNSASFFRTRQVLTPPRTQVELWRTDGTEAGTRMEVNLGVLSTLSEKYVRTTSAHFFFMSNATDGTSLWRTDGTAGGTVFVKKLDAGQVPVMDVGTTQDGAVGLFTLLDGGNTEVWKTDGTAAGTVRLETFGKRMLMLGSLGGSVYLVDSAYLPIMTLSSVSLAGGGKANVTQLENPWGNDPDAGTYVQGVVRSGDTLYFSVAIGTSGPAPRRVWLWVTQGTAGTTRRVPAALSTSDEYWSPLIAADNGGVVFTAGGEGSFAVPWVSYGTDETSSEITTSPSRTHLATAFARVGNRIYFGARDDTGYHQLWAMPSNVSCTP